MFSSNYIYVMFTKDIQLLVFAKVSAVYLYMRHWSHVEPSKVEPP
jgi:hypothetical protein